MWYICHDFLKHLALMSRVSALVSSLYLKFLEASATGRSLLAMILGCGAGGSFLFYSLSSLGVFPLKALYPHSGKERGAGLDVETWGQS